MNRRQLISGGLAAASLANAGLVERIAIAETRQPKDRKVSRRGADRKTKTSAQLASLGKTTRGARKAKDSRRTQAAASAAMRKAWGRLTKGDRVARLHALLGGMVHFHRPVDPPPWGPRHPPADPPPDCVPCGEIKPLPGDPCQGLRDQKADLQKKIAVLELVRQILTDIQVAQSNAAFWGGVANMIGDMVSAAISVASAGTATAASQAAKRVLTGMAKDAIVDYVTGLLVDQLPSPFSEMVDGTLDAAALDGLLGAIRNQISPLYIANADLSRAISECQDEYKATLKQIKLDNFIVEECRKASPTHCK